MESQINMTRVRIRGENTKRLSEPLPHSLSSCLSVNRKAIKRMKNNNNKANNMSRDIMTSDESCCFSKFISSSFIIPYIRTASSSRSKIHLMETIVDSNKQKRLVRIKDEQIKHLSIYLADSRLRSKLL